MKEIKVATIIFFDEKKRILLQDRLGISRRGEEWAFFGGHIEGDETPEEAMVREVKEELDFELKDSYKFIKELNFKYPDVNFTDYVFISPLRNNLKKFKLKEGNGMKLFSVAEARKLKMFSNDGEILDLLEKVL